METSLLVTQSGCQGSASPEETFECPPGTCNSYSSSVYLLAFIGSVQPEICLWLYVSGKESSYLSGPTFTLASLGVLQEGAEETYPLL